MQASDKSETKEQSADTLGSKLRKARESQNLSFDTLSQELRISVEQLAALEDDRYDDVGPPVFARGYIRHYGARLGLSADELLADYEAAGQSAVELAPSNTIKLRDERQITVWVIALAALVVIGVLLAIWWWLGSDSASSTVFSATEPQPAATDRERIEPPPRPAQSPARGEPLVNGPADRDDDPPGAELPGAEPGADETGADDAPAVVDTVPGEVPAEPAPPVIDGPALEIFFVEDSWAEITGAGGEQLYYALGQAGTRTVIPLDGQIDLFFGNAAGVELAIDGEPIGIPASARRGELAQFELGPP